MYPIIFRLGSIVISSLGICVFLGFILSAFIFWRRARELGLDQEKSLDLTFICSFSGLALSRIFFVLSEGEVFGFNLRRWWDFARFPGFQSLGLLSGIIFSLYYLCRRWHLNFYKVADELTFALSFFFIFSSLGIFLDGSGRGKETSLFWGIFFPGQRIRTHPIGIYQALFSLLVFILLLRIERGWRLWPFLRNKDEGFLFWLFIALFSLLNLIVAFLKVDGLYFSYLEKTVSLIFLVLSIVKIYLRTTNLPFFSKLKRRKNES